MSIVRREIVLPVERERAWELLTESGELETWLADEVEFEPQEVRPLRAAWDDGDERAGVVEEVEPERRIRFVWTVPTTPPRSNGRSPTPSPARVCWSSSAASPPTARAMATFAPRWRAGHVAPSPGAVGSGAWVRARAARVDAVFAALATPRAARSCGAGARAGLTASRLAGELPVTRQAVSKHLAALDRAGLVRASRAGRETRYELTPAPLGDAMEWMAGVGARWDASLARLAARARE
jgi:uncharacterized protein YndB with AHSA1/START domain/DNA-binding transcriptional ArsR family regulator